MILLPKVLIQNCCSHKTKQKNDNTRGYVITKQTPSLLPSKLFVYYEW